MVCNLEIDIGRDGTSSGYPIAVRGPGGSEASGVLRLDVESLAARRAELQNSILASTVPTTRGSRPTTVEASVREVGQQLFCALICERVYGQYSAARALAAARGEPLRVVLRLAAPELAGLPWETLYDEEHDAYLCKQEPLVRHVAAPTPPPPTVDGRLRVLGLVAAPANLAPLDTDGEKLRLEHALAPLQDRVELRWAPSGSWDALRRTLTDGPWHVLHFVGHGRFDPSSGRGQLALEAENGRAHWVGADRVRDLISIQNPPPRLVVLNSCASAETSVDDLFSSTAATIVRGGACAVVAMQYAISDEGAKAFAESLYQAIATNHTISESVRIARIGIAGPDESLEWATPVLYLRGDDAQDAPLFAVLPAPRVAQDAQPPVAPGVPAPALPPTLKLEVPSFTAPAPRSQPAAVRSVTSADPRPGHREVSTPVRPSIVAVPSPPTAPAGGQARPPEHPAGVPAERPPSRRRWMIVGAIVALLAAIGVVAIIGADRGSNSTAPTSGSSSSTTSAATSSSSTVAPPPVEQTLEKVTGLAIGTVTSTSAEVSWQPVRGADGYRVAVIDRDTGQQSPLPDATNGSTSATANDLQPGRRYRFTVRAYASNANDGAESTIRFETPGAGSESAPTPTFAVAATGPTSVHLHIDPVEGATEYTVEYVPDNGLMRSQTLRLGADETEKDLTDLLFLPQSSYTFTVTLTVGTTTSDPVTHPVGPFGSAVPPDGGPQGSTTTGQ